MITLCALQIVLMMMIIYYTFTAEFGDERILKIGQHMAKLWARVVSNA